MLSKNSFIIFPFCYVGDPQSVLFILNIFHVRKIKIMASVAAKRQRNSNYTTEETMKLIHLVEARLSVVESKTPDAATWHEKKVAWDGIAEEYNVSFVNRRTGEQLRQKYESLKKHTRKYAAKRKEEALQTEGSMPTTPENRIFEAVLKLIQLSCVGLENGFDSDKAGETIQNPQEKLVQVNLSNDGRLPSSNETSMIVPEIVIVGNANFDMEDESSVPFTWDSYSQAVLVPTHPALKEDNLIKQENPLDSITPAHATSPCETVTSQHLCNSSPSTSNTAHTPLPRTQPVSVPSIPQVPLFSTNIAQTPPVNCCPQKWTTRRRPVKKNVQKRFSHSRQALHPWASARKNLAITQRNLLIKEFRANEKRKQSLFLWERKKLKLEVQSLSLDIKLKEVRLRNLQE